MESKNTLDSLPSGICSTISMRHEGEGPVQKNGLDGEQRMDKLMNIRRLNN